MSECPECHKPVGNEPHDDCLRAIQARQEQEVPAEMPCPACGKPLAEGWCRNPGCEEATPVSS